MLAARHITPILFGIALSFGASAGVAQDTSHEDHAASEIVLTLNSGAKWQGDSYMHTAMDSMRKAISDDLAAIHDDKLPAEGYKTLATSVMAQVDFMVENCVLEPEVDEQLHVVLEQVIDGAMEMENSAEPRAGAVKVVQALNAYGEHFEHPGWQPLD